MKIRYPPRKPLPRPSWRIRTLARPKRVPQEIPDGLPLYTDHNVRNSALNADCPDRINDIGYAYLRKLQNTLQTYSKIWDDNRIEYIQKSIEASNNTMYSKLANCFIDLKKQEPKKKVRVWSEGDWKKHMEYIGPLAEPKKVFPPKPLKKFKWKPLEKLLPRLNNLSRVPSDKVYRRISEESWYRDPTKVPSAALRYEISDRVKEIAQPKVIPTEYRD